MPLSLASKCRVAVPAGTRHRDRHGLRSDVHRATAGGNRKGYAGYEFEPATGYTLWHVRHRVLNSNLGKWTRPDPLWFMGGNVAEYAFSSPVKLQDASGLLPVTGCAKVIANTGSDDFIDAMLETIRMSCPSCSPPSIRCVACDVDDQWEGITYFPVDGGCPSIEICNNRGWSEEQLTGTLIHELIHYYDLCASTTMPLPPRDEDNACASCFCMEIRAAKWDCIKVHGTANCQRLKDCIRQKVAKLDWDGGSCKDACGDLTKDKRRGLWDRYFSICVGMEDPWEGFPGVPHDPLGCWPGRKKGPTHTLNSTNTQHPCD